MMDSNELLENTKKISKCMRMNAEHCFDGCSVCDFYCTKEERDETFKAVIAMLEEGKDTNVPANSALDHIHNVVAENERKRGYEQAKAKYDAKLEEIKSRFKDFYFNKGYDAGHKEGYERGKEDAAISARTLAKHLTANFDDVLSVADVLETLEALEAVAKGELP